jgi:alkaline phosphatase D
MSPTNFEQLLSTPKSRRQLLIGVGALTGAAIISPHLQLAAAPSSSPFTLGVASGEPLPTSVVLWTRLAPKPLQGGGMPARPVPVQWQVAADETMRQVVRSGTAMAMPQWGHSVHVEVQGLAPARNYWYQFRVGDALSPIGRTRTAPRPGNRLNRLRFAFASCQHYEVGYYTAYRDMANADLDFVVHLGDYIYENTGKPGQLRSHNSSECKTLEDYRDRYALYKTDPDLQAAHAAFPWIVTWDDHEVDNNYAALIPEDDQSLDAFRQRRIAAYQAYYEHMPLRRSSLPKDISLQLFRRFRFGDLAELSVLDTRQYRTDQPCQDGFKPRCAEALASTATLLGEQQERWLFEGLSRSQTRWNVLAQQVMMASFDVDPRPESDLYNLDQWDGYVANRDRLFQVLQQQKVANPIVITGDVHSSWVHDLKLDFQNPNSPTIGTEFVGTSISSGFGQESIARATAALPANPHTKFFNGAYRGYVLCEVTPKQWRTDFRAVANIADPKSPVSTLASFVVEDGKPGAVKA